MRQDEIDKKAIFLMGVRQEEQDLHLTKGQCLEKRKERLNEYYGEIPTNLPLGQQEMMREK